MKLFTSTEVVTTKEKQTALNVKRLDSVSAELQKKHQELAQLEIEFQIASDRHLVKFKEEDSMMQDKINWLKANVRELEERKKQALLPIQEREKEVERVEKQQSKEQQRLELKEDVLDETFETLEARLSEVAEREAEARRVSKLQLNAQKGIDMQKEQVVNQTKNFSSILTSTLAGFTEKETRLNKKETEIAMKEKVLVDKEIQLIKIEKGFADRERAINDKYETLQRALKRK